MISISQIQSLISLLDKQKLKRIHHAVNARSNRFVLRVHEAPSAISELSQDIEALFGSDFPPLDSLKLSDVLSMQATFTTAYKRHAEHIYLKHGYHCMDLTGKNTYENARTIAKIQLNLYQTKKLSHIILHCLGNNSQEGLMSLLMIYRTLIEDAASSMDEKHFYQFLQHIVFINSSAGGKGTAMSEVAGYAIPRLPPALHLHLDKDKKLLSQTIKIERDELGTLQQFANPDRLIITITRQSEALTTATILTQEKQKIVCFKRDIPVRIIAGGLFFGKSEALMNERALMKHLSLLKKTLSVSLGKTKFNILDKWQPRILREQDSFNTGSNCQNIAKILHHHFPERMHQLLITHTQKSEQGARAATTALTQTCVQSQSAFQGCFYLNPEYLHAIDKMSEEQRIVFAMNLLTEILVEFSYLIKQKHFHHPLPKEQVGFKLALRLIKDIYNKLNGTSLSLNTLSFDKALHFFKFELWPCIEAKLIPLDEKQNQRFLTTYFYNEAIWQTQSTMQSPTAAHTSQYFSGTTLACWFSGLCGFGLSLWLPLSPLLATTLISAMAIWTSYQIIKMISQRDQQIKSILTLSDKETAHLKSRGFCPLMVTEVIRLLEKELNSLNSYRLFFSKTMSNRRQEIRALIQKLKAGTIKYQLKASPAQAAKPVYPSKIPDHSHNQCQVKIDTAQHFLSLQPQ